MSLPSGWELIVIALLILLVFGARKLPDAARSLGRSMRIFKSEVKEMANDDKDKTDSAPAEQAQQQELPQSQRVERTDSPVDPQQRLVDQPTTQAEPGQNSSNH